MSTLTQISGRATAATPSPASAGMFVVNAIAEVLWTNHAAERLLEAGRPFIVVERRLRGADETTEQELRSAAFDPAPAPPGEPSPLLWVAGPTGRLAVRLHRAAALAGLNAHLPDAALALVAWDPWATPQLDTRVLRELFRLTPREAELALALSLGANPRQAATELKVSTETARTYLRRIFRKTGVSRQADLVRLVVSNCRPVP